MNLQDASIRSTNLGAKKSSYVKKRKQSVDTTTTDTAKRKRANQVTLLLGDSQHEPTSSSSSSLVSETTKHQSGDSQKSDTAVTHQTTESDPQSPFSELLSFNPHQYLSLLRGASSNAASASVMHSMALETLTSHIHSLQQSLSHLMAQSTHTIQETKLIRVHLKEKNDLLMRLMKQRRHDTQRTRTLRRLERDMCRRFFFEYMRDRAQDWSAEKLFLEMERDWQRREELAVNGNDSAFWRDFLDEGDSQGSSHSEGKSNDSMSKTGETLASAVAAGGGAASSSSVDTAVSTISPSKSSSTTSVLDNFEQETLDMMREGMILQHGQIKKYLESMKQEWFLEKDTTKDESEPTKEAQVLSQVQETIQNAKNDTQQVAEPFLTDDTLVMLIGEQTAEAIIKREEQEAALEALRRKAAEVEKAQLETTAAAETQAPQKMTVDGIQTNFDSQSEQEDNIAHESHPLNTATETETETETSHSEKEPLNDDIIVDTSKKTGSSGVIRYIGGSPIPPHTPDAPSPTAFLEEDNDNGQDSMGTDRTQYTRKRADPRRRSFKPITNEFKESKLQKMQSTSALPSTTTSKVRKRSHSSSINVDKADQAASLSGTSDSETPRHHSQRASSLSRLAQKNALQKMQTTEERPSSPLTQENSRRSISSPSTTPTTPSVFITETMTTSMSPPRKKKPRSRRGSTNAAKEIQRMRKRKALEMRKRRKNLQTEEEEEEDSYLTDEEIRISNPGTLERQSSLGPVKDFEAKLKEGQTIMQINIEDNEDEEKGVPMEHILHGKEIDALSTSELDMLRQTLSPTERFFPRDNIRAKLKPSQREFALSPDVVDPVTPEDDHDGSERGSEKSKKSSIDCSSPASIHQMSEHSSPGQERSSEEQDAEEDNANFLNDHPSSSKAFSPAKKISPVKRALGSQIGVRTFDASTQSRPAQRPITSNKSVHTSPSDQRVTAPSTKVVTIIQQKKESNKRYLVEINDLRESLTLKDKEIAHLKRILKDIENQRSDELENTLRRALHEERRYLSTEKRQKEEYPTARIPFTAVDNLDDLSLEIVDQEEAREKLEIQPPLDLPPLNFTQEMRGHNSLFPSTQMNRQFLRSAQSSRSARPRIPTKFDNTELMDNFPPPSSHMEGAPPKRRFSAVPPPIPTRVAISARRSSSQACTTFTSKQGNTALYSPRPQHSSRTHQSPRKSADPSTGQRPSTAAVTTGRRGSGSTRRKKLKSSQGTRRSSSRVRDSK
uniref:Uncharacterized protein n=1 Tax=Percolomonas cosmopolitus TaxID=63605 RepID=A0A7S1KQU3_9EUKA